MELLAPAGNMEKLKTAIYFGADAVYVAGKKFGLRAFAGNFDENELLEASNFVHENHKKIYVTVNIVAHNSDFDGLEEYLKFLEEIGVDAIIVSDIGIMQIAKQCAPKLDIHVSTQANVTNKFTAKFFADFGAKRIVLARELSLVEIKEIRDFLPADVELECFVHGAMCISYSGRCLLSNYLTSRDGNRGACVQACRWEYTICEKSRGGDGYEIQEDNRGTYILNSKDLNMIQHLKELEEAGVESLKIEGRMKSAYYVGNTVNAYRRALDSLKNGIPLSNEIYNETFKSSHRKYTTGFYFGRDESECLESSMPVQSHEFMAVVVADQNNGEAIIQQRNRFAVGDTLEVLSPNQTFNKQILVEKMFDLNGNVVVDAKNVKEQLILKTNLPLKSGDILRKEI
ncbi:MAG: U32 family peptidase [Firmicutes bacterium]|nr:U32 family peptidase [Bacillota bacterium]MDY3658760.1 U32 family peptidase [Eubacteriales bacterium]